MHITYAKADRLSNLVAFLARCYLMGYMFCHTSDPSRLSLTAFAKVGIQDAHYSEVWQQKFADWLHEEQV